MQELNLEIFEIIATEKACDIAFPLKEKMLIEVIKQFVERFKSDSGQLLFGGGTSLVCAYDELTKRFSEDADFRFVPCPKSTKHIRQDLINIAKSLDGFELVGEPISDSRKIEFRFNDTANLVQSHSSLRPYIKVEFFFTDKLFYPPVQKKLYSFYNKMADNLPETEVMCVSLQDTSIDKVSSFLWRIYSDNTEHSQYNPADMRHMHDLTFLSKCFCIDETFKLAVKQVFEEDLKHRLKKDISFRDISNQVIDLLVSNKKYKADFTKYVSNISYAKTAERLTFEEAVSAFQLLIKQLQD